MQEAENSHPNSAPPECDQIDPRRIESPPSAKLRDKLQKLAQWRIDPSLIEFPVNAREFRGGNATVSQAFLAPNPDAQGNINHFRDTASEPGPSDQNPPPDSDPTQASGNDEQSGDSRSEGDDKDPAVKEDGGEETTTILKEQESRRQTPKQKVWYQPLATGIAVAVKKLIVAQDADSERILGLALRESEFLAELSHPNVIKLEGFAEDASKNLIWLIFPWEENGNLRDFLASGNWEIPERISLINDVTKGVEHIHSLEPPICHGDLKSLNILVNSEYLAVITDFGSARRLADTEPDKPRSRNERKPPGTPDLTNDETNPLQTLFCASTNTITLTGCKYTLRWAAPELLSDDQPRLGSDIWALGWIAYEVMTNAIPFHDVKADTVVIKRVIQGDLPSITADARMSLVRALCSLMALCWSINPNQRPTAEECRKSISWMPMIIPAPTQVISSMASKEREARILIQLGFMYKWQGDYNSASNSYHKALNIYPSDNKSKERADALSGLADAHRYRWELNEASTLYFRALQIYVDIGSENSRASTLYSLGEVNRLQRQFNSAIQFYSESLQIYTATGDRSGRSSALWGLAEVHRSRSEYNEAVTFFSESLQIRTAIGDQQGRSDTLWGLATVQRHQGEYGEVHTLFGLAEIHRLRYEYGESIKLYSGSIQIFVDLGDEKGRADALYGLAEVHRSRDEYNDATTLHSEALRIYTDLGNQFWRAEVLLRLAETHDRQSHHDDAVFFYTEANRVLEQIGDPGRAADALTKADNARKELEGGA